jgi:hypothetical protein
MTEAVERGAAHDHSWAADVEEVAANCPDFNPGLKGTGIRCPGEAGKETTMAEPLEQDEDKRPDPPVVAVLVQVVVSMTEAQAAEYAEWYGLEREAGTVEGVTTEGGGSAEGIADLEERGVADAIRASLRDTFDPLWGLVTVTAFGEETVPVGKGFPGCEDGYVTGLCGHRVARSEWAAGFRKCERC